MIQVHLLSVLKVLGKLPLDVVAHHLATRPSASPAFVHPLAFIRPMIQEKDPNVLYTLLSGLRSLPTAIWAGTAPAGSENDLIGKSSDFSETLEPLQSTLAPATPATSDDPFHDVFGPFEGGSTSHSPDYVTPSGSLGLSNISASPNAVPQTPHLPPLFEEEEVGIVVGFLRSEDSMLRRNVGGVLCTNSCHRLSKFLDAASSFQYRLFGMRGYPPVPRLAPGRTRKNRSRPG